MCVCPWPKQRPAIGARNASARIYLVVKKLKKWFLFFLIVRHSQLLFCTTQFWLPRFINYRFSEKLYLCAQILNINSTVFSIIILFYVTIAFLFKWKSQIWAHAIKANIFQNPKFSFTACLFFIKLVSFHKYFILGIQCFFVVLASSFKMLITMVDICVLRMA